MLVSLSILVLSRLVPQVRLLQREADLAEVERRPQEVDDRVLRHRVVVQVRVVLEHDVSHGAALKYLTIV